MELKMLKQEEKAGLLMQIKKPVHLIENFLS